jgi:hypothetical protein
METIPLCDNALVNPHLPALIPQLTPPQLGPLYLN